MTDNLLQSATVATTDETAERAAEKAEARNMLGIGEAENMEAHQVTQGAQGVCSTNPSASRYLQNMEEATAGYFSFPSFDTWDEKHQLNGRDRVRIHT
jgi:hypothetical protein